MVDLCLINCKIVPENIECSIGIENGEIVSIKKIPPKSEKIIDIKRNIILPGLIDAHVHFRDPGLTYKEDFKTGSVAAACGGFTTVLDMPNTKPPTTTSSAFLEKLKIASQKSIIDFGLHAGVDDIKEIKKIAELKPASFKLYMDLIDNGILMEVFREIASLDRNLLISVHAEDRDIVKHCTGRLKDQGNPEIYAKVRPPLSEVVAVSNVISMAAYFNLKVHICHVSTRKSLNFISNMQDRSIGITSEITPHHLFLDSDYLKKCGNFAKTNPPLRNDKNRVKMDDLNNIDIIGTDHAPHTIPEKEEDVWNALPGIPNLETTLPLLLTQINQNKMTFVELKRLLCENPARIFNFENKGQIAEGMDADFVIVDIKKESVINPNEFKTKAKYSPFEGFKVKGMPVMTIVRGNVVMEEGKVFKNNGKFVYDN